MVCGNCGKKGHNRKTCPLLCITDSVATKKKGKKTKKKKKGKNLKKVDSSKFIYVVFDLETTGFSKHYDDVVEIFAEITSPEGVATNTSFYSKIRPMNKVGYTEKIHGL